MNFQCGRFKRCVSGEREGGNLILFIVYYRQTAPAAGGTSLAGVVKAMWGTQVEFSVITGLLPRLSLAEKVKFMIVHHVMDELTLAGE